MATYHKPKSEYHGGGKTLSASSSRIVHSARAATGAARKAKRAKAGNSRKGRVANH